jgi:hypothetical protein
MPWIASLKRFFSIALVIIQVLALMYFNEVKKAFFWIAAGMLNTSARHWYPIELKKFIKYWRGFNFDIFSRV